MHALRVVPHAPFNGASALVAVQVPLLFPPLVPLHIHVAEPPFAGFEGVAGFAVPVAQYVPVGNASVAVYNFAAVPHVPFNGMGSEHEELVPPLAPLQFHK